MRRSSASPSQRAAFAGLIVAALAIFVLGGISLYRVDGPGLVAAGLPAFVVPLVAGRNWNLPRRAYLLAPALLASALMVGSMWHTASGRLSGAILVGSAVASFGVVFMLRLQFNPDADAAEHPADAAE